MNLTYEQPTPQEIKARKERLWGKPRTVNIIVEARKEHQRQRQIDEMRSDIGVQRYKAEQAKCIKNAIRAIEQKMSRPLWKRKDVYFDHHVTAWKLSKEPPPMKFLRWRCEELGVAFEKMIGGRGPKELVEIRFALIKEISATFGTSQSELGRMFNRDHSSIRWALLDGRRDRSRKVKAKGKS